MKSPYYLYVTRQKYNVSCSVQDFSTFFLSTQCLNHNHYSLQVPFGTLQLRYTDLGGEVYIGSSIKQQLCNTHVLIVCCNMEGCETSLQRKCENRVKIMIIPIYLYKNGQSAWNRLRYKVKRQMSSTKDCIVECLEDYFVINSLFTLLIEYSEVFLSF